MDKSETLLRLPDVLLRFPVSKSSWYAGIREGKYPPPLRLGPRTAAWRQSDIQQLIERVAPPEKPNEIGTN
jgi:prophage regulatory protein